MERGRQSEKKITVKGILSPLFLCRADFPVTLGGTNWSLIALCRVDNLVSIGTDTLRGVLKIGRRLRLTLKLRGRMKKNVKALMLVV